MSNGYAFFGRAFSSKSFRPGKFARVDQKPEFESCEDAVSQARRLFRGNPRQLFARGDDRVMLVQSNGKQEAKMHFESVSKSMTAHGAAGLRSLLVIDSDKAPDPERLRDRVLDEMAGRWGRSGIAVKRDPAGPKGMTSECTVSRRRQSLRAAVMTIPTNFEEVFARLPARHGIASGDGPPKAAIASAIEGPGVDGMDGLCGHVFGKLPGEIGRDPALSRVLGELCEFVHG